jgi:DNA polymerase I-like protein with 3'-5' exonuclease and polymerase domains
MNITFASNVLFEGRFEQQIYTTSIDAAIERLSKETDLKYIGIDTETTGLDPLQDILFLVQIGTEKFQYVFDFCSMNDAQINSLSNLINRHELIIGHNLKFDYKFLHVNNIRITAPMWDIMLVDQIIHSFAAPRNIKLVMEEYVSKEVSNEFDKSKRISFTKLKTNSFTNEQIVYAAQDVVHLVSCMRNQKKHELINQSVVNLENGIIPVYSKMELHGMRIDQVAWKAIAADLKADIIKTGEELDAMTEEYMGIDRFKNRQFSLFEEPEYKLREININWGSSNQVVELFSILNIPCIDPETGKNSVSSKALEGNKKHPFIALLLKYKQLKTKYNSFGKKFLDLVHPNTNRIHCDFLQIGTATGRVACRKPNLQNIPARDKYGERFRKAFIAGEGNYLVIADYSQAEIRILAELAGDREFIQSLNEGKDPYNVKGTLMFGVTVSKTENKHLRDVTKSLILGLNYGMGPTKLSVKLGVDMDKAKEYINMFNKSSPKIAKALRQLNQFAKQNLYAVSMSPFRRRRQLSDYAEHEIGRMGQNHPIQGTNADLTKLALYNIYKEFGDSVAIINTVHDEIVLEVRKDKAEEVCKRVLQIMKESGKTICKYVNMDATANVSNCWEKD